MCTCSYIPKKKGFLFAVNRDEAPSRAGKETTATLENQSLWYIKEPRAGGTNFCINNHGRLACLLNGAKNDREPKGPFVESRGIMVLNSFKYPSVKAFFEIYDFEKVDSFTLVLLDYSGLFVVSWNGKDKTIKEVDANQPCLWASPKLYPDLWQRRRQQWFQNFLHKHPVPQRHNLYQFHLNGGVGNARFDMVMNRDNKVRTVSVSALSFSSKGWAITHKDLIENDYFQRSLADNNII